jgi:hypothetical protein
MSILYVFCGSFIGDVGLQISLLDMPFCFVLFCFGYILWFDTLLSTQHKPAPIFVNYQHSSHFHYFFAFISYNKSQLIMYYFRFLLGK